MRIEAQATIHDLILQVQNLSLELRPFMLEDLGLLPTLLWHFDRFTSKTCIQVDFVHEGLTEKRFPAAYRIAQEALTNVARHAGVPSVQVQATADEQAWRMQISDWGCGFDAASAESTHRSIGLFGMRERGRLLNGELTIESPPETGTRILAELFF